MYCVRFCTSSTAQAGAREGLRDREKGGIGREGRREGERELESEKGEGRERGSLEGREREKGGGGGGAETQTDDTVSFSWVDSNMVVVKLTLCLVAFHAAGNLSVRMMRVTKVMLSA
jgi:hypothetical protein